MANNQNQGQGMSVEERRKIVQQKQNKVDENIKKNVNEILREHSYLAKSVTNESGEANLVKGMNTPRRDDHDALVGKGWEAGEIEADSRTLGNLGMEDQEEPPVFNGGMMGGIDDPNLQPVDGGGNEGNSIPPKIVINQAMPNEFQNKEKFLKNKNINSVLAALRQEFGIDNIKTYDFKLNDFIFTLAPVNNSLISYSYRLADIFGGQVSEINHLRLLCQAACMVVAINNVPIYDIYNLDTKNQDVNDLQKLPDIVRRVAAGFLLEDFLYKLHPDVPLKINDAYVEKIDKSFVYTNSLDEEDDNKISYACPVDGCDYKVRLLPIIEKGYEMPYFCMFHGGQLERIVKNTGKTNPL